MKEREKIIRKPAGCFESYEDYSEHIDEYGKQFPRKEMEINCYTDLHISNVDTKRIKVCKLKSAYSIDIDRHHSLFFSNFSELCAFANAITDKVAEIAPETDDNG